MPSTRYGSTRDKQYRRAVDSWGEYRLATNLLLEPGQDTIYGAPGQVPGYDWPNPSGAGRGTALTAQRLRAANAQPENLQADVFYIGSDRFYGAPGQTPPWEWQPPRGYSRASSLRTHLDEHLLDTLSTVAPTFYGAAGQAITYSFQLDLPTRLKSSAIDLRGFVDQGEPLILIGSDRFYGAPGQAISYSFQLDLPTRLKASAIALRGFVNQGEPIPLVGMDLFYGAPGQVPGWEWQPPRGYPRAVSLRTHIDDHLLDALSTVPPSFYGAPGQAVTYGFQLDLPNRLKASAIDLRGFVNQGEPLTLVGSDRFYAGPGQTPAFVWELSRASRRAQQPLADADSVLALFGVIAQPPLLSFDQPNPARLARRLPADVAADNIVTLLAVPGQPFLSYVQTNPRLQARRGQPEALALELNTLLIPPVVAPWRNFDWPNPRGYKRILPIHLRDQQGVLYLPKLVESAVYIYLDASYEPIITASGSYIYVVLANASYEPIIDMDAST